MVQPVWRRFSQIFHRFIIFSVTMQLYRFDGAIRWRKVAEMEVKSRQQKSIVHVSFEIALLLKGLNGLAEILGGVSMLFLSPGRLDWLTHFVTHHELAEDPRDAVANFLLQLSSGFTAGTQHFFMFYLMSHGIVKCFLIFMLWRRKLWAYPLSIFVFILFIAYQVYRYTLTESAFLIVLTIFDLVVIALTYLEYQRIKSS